MDEREREELARQTRDEFDAIFRVLNRRFGRRWWWLQWNKLTAPYWAARRAIRGRFVYSPVKVEPDLLARATQTLARCAELREVDEEVDAESVRDVAADLNGILPAKHKVDLSRYTCGPWELLSGAQLDVLRKRLVRELGVRYMEFVSLDEVVADDVALDRLIATRIEIAEDGLDPPEEGPSKGAESWLRLPRPSETSDLDELRNLTSGGYEVERLKAFVALRDELRAAALEALRECTEPDGWVYAVDGPEGNFICHKFWPHRAYDGMAWTVDPIPNADDQVVVAADFSWGLYATQGFDDATDWALSIFGRPLVDAISSRKPRVLSKAIRVNGISG